MKLTVPLRFLGPCSISTMTAFCGSLGSISPCSEKVVEVALRFAKARRDAFDPADSVLAHGDAHAWNTLLDSKTGECKFVDPDGLLIERAYDLSISMREWSAELLAGDPSP